MSRIVLVGFPHATVVSDILSLLSEAGQPACSLHPDNFLNNEFDNSDRFAILVTKDLELRKKLTNKLDFDNLQRATFVHKSCFVDPSASIGEGTIISHFSSVLYQANVGKDCLIAQYAMVAHKSVTGQGSILTPGVIIAGSSTIGKYCKLGLRSSIIDNITVCDGVQLAAGALVTKNITYPGYYVGSPARKVSKEDTPR